MAQFDDDLDDEVVPQKKGKQRPQPEEEDEPKSKKSSRPTADDDDEDVVPSKKKGHQADLSDDDDVDFGDEELMKNRGFLERIEVKERDQYARFSILPNPKPKKGYSHYVEGKGSFRCFTDHSDKKAPKASCCKYLGDPRPNVVAMVVHYTNASMKNGKLPADQPIEFGLKYIKLSRTQYAKISHLAEEDGCSVYGIDILMFKSNSGIGYDYSRISSKAKYLSNPELVAAVKEELESYLDGAKLRSRLAKKITKAELNGYLTAANRGDDDESDLGEIEDI